MNQNRTREAAFDTVLTHRKQTQTKLIENMKGKILTEEKATRKRWTEYCTELHNYKPKADANILKNEDKIENRER